MLRCHIETNYLTFETISLLAWQVIYKGHAISWTLIDEGILIIMCQNCTHWWRYFNYEGIIDEAILIIICQNCTPEFLIIAKDTQFFFAKTIKINLSIISDVHFEVVISCWLNEHLELEHASGIYCCTIY